MSVQRVYSLSPTVSKKSLTFLQDVEDHSVIDISSVNPKLYEHITEMGQLQVKQNIHS